MGSRTSLSPRERRHQRIRRRVKGGAERPRLCVFRSLKHIYAQIVDDMSGRTLVTVSSLSAGVKEALAASGGKPKISVAKAVGIAIAKQAKQQGVERVAFDRGGYLYHGRVKALADGAREGGLVF
jgi:large subunit ribosomal protein L18